MAALAVCTLPVAALVALVAVHLLGQAAPTEVLPVSPCLVALKAMMVARVQILLVATMVVPAVAVQVVRVFPSQIRLPVVQAVLP